MAQLSDEDRANLVAFLDGELDERTAHALETKLHTDPQARAEAEALRRTWGLLDYLPRPEPSPSFTNRTLERVSAMRPALQTLRMPRPAWRRWAVGLLWAAAVLVAASGSFAAVYFLTRPGQQV